MFEISQDETHDQEKKNEEMMLLKTLEGKANKERITTPFLTKYERATILGIRAKMIEKNSPLYISVNFSRGYVDPLMIAEQEL